MIQDPTLHCTTPQAAYDLARRAAAHERWALGAAEAAQFVTPMRIYGGWYSKLFPTLVLRVREVPHA
jgi:hypothetical protein